MYCYFRATAHPVGGDKLVWCNDGIISRVKPENSENKLLKCHFIHFEAYRGLRGENAINVPFMKSTSNAR
jgi:hypothetical protein